MTHRFTPLAVAAALAALAVPASAVSVIGNLANFDAVNNTGHHAYGFEIELEDPDLWDDSSNASLHHSSKYVYSVFGLDRNFGGNLGTQVTRFSQVAVTNYDDGLGRHAGVRITYGLAGGATPGAGAVFTQAAGPNGFSTPGESCWPGANANWTANPCDHFGVSTTGNVLSTRYSWVVQAAPGAPLVSQLAAIPAVVYQAPAPAPGQAAQPVVARIEAVEVEPARDARNWGTAVWVKTFTTVTKNKDIDLGNLLVGQGGDDDLNANIDSVEIEWRLLQDRPKSPDDDGAIDGIDADEAQENALDLDDDSKSFIRRYEFYEYLGGYDAKRKNRAECGRDNVCRDDPLTFESATGQRVVGNFLGRQIAGFNADPALAAAVPEPQTWAMFAAGLLALGGLRRRSRQG
jgi:PEP-CTERM motif